MYAAQIAALEKSADVDVGDLSGAASIGAMATAVLDRAPREFTLVGFSMGGMVALEICRQVPGRVRQLALLNTTPFAERPERLLQREQQIAAVRTGGLREVLIGAMKPRYLAQAHRMRQDLRSAVLVMGLELGPEVFLRQSEALATRPDFADLLPRIDCPALVLGGREDELCPPSVHEQMAVRLPRADLVVLADCGHLSPLEQPEAVTGALLHLLTRQ